MFSKWFCPVFGQLPNCRIVKGTPGPCPAYSTPTFAPTTESNGEVDDGKPTGMKELVSAAGNSLSWKDTQAFEKATRVESVVKGKELSWNAISNLKHHAPAPHTPTAAPTARARTRGSSSLGTKALSVCAKRILASCGRDDMQKGPVCEDCVTKHLAKIDSSLEPTDECNRDQVEKFCYFFQAEDGTGSEDSGDSADTPRDTRLYTGSKDSLPAKNDPQKAHTANPTEENEGPADPTDPTELPDDPAAPFNCKDGKGAAIPGWMRCDGVPNCQVCGLQV
jgi:hypothetical protein